MQQHQRGQVLIGGDYPADRCSDDAPLPDSKARAGGLSANCPRDVPI
jgi:hypothetical protein